MSSVVSKKYVKAIILSSSAAELESIVNALSSLCKYFGDEKLKNIIALPGLKAEKKADFLLELMPDSNKKLKNLINLLAQNKRLGLIPEIASELVEQISAAKGEYMGNVYSEQPLSDTELAELAKKFSSHFNSDVKLTAASDKFNGAKVELDGLGVEVSFSVDRFKSQLSEYILKAI